MDNEMMPSFSLTFTKETLFGWGCSAELAARVSRYRRVAVARGGGVVEVAGVLAGVEVISLPPQTREPEVEDVDAAAAFAREAGAEAVVAIGGGSVLDLGKAAAAMAAQPAGTSVRLYLEGVGDGRGLAADPLPFIAVPTTAGTGSEATKNAVISSRREGFKKSLRDPRMLAALVVLDPALTVSMPPALTAWTGLDALTQLIEAYTSNRANPVTDALAEAGLAQARMLPAAYRDGADRAAREAMLLAAHLSGLCLANAGLGAAHGIAAALGACAPVHHGLACALALPWVMAVNAPVVGTRYARVAELLGAGDALDLVWSWLRELHIPRVTDLPAVAPLFHEAHLPALAAACHGNSLRGNPRPLSDDDLVRLLRAMRDADSPRALSDLP
jgi:alcohol dehydrogenase class IV